MSEGRSLNIVSRNSKWLIALGLLIFVLLIAWQVSRRIQENAVPKGPSPTSQIPVAVKIEAVKAQDFDIYLRGLGTVTAYGTVTLRTRVQGQVVQIPFKEGDKVKAGDVVAQIDPRPYQVALDQAKGTLEQDRSQYENAKLDLKRYQTLREQNSIAGQTVDTQMALVKKYQALLVSDQAAVDNAKLQLEFTRIVAPIPGRLGLRQIDVGNILTSNDAQAIAVLTQTQPIYVIFTLPESSLDDVRGPLLAGKKLTVDVYDRADTKRLAQGSLTIVDNQIDVTTGTYKLKAEFSNEDDALFPNQFVNARILVRTIKDATTVASASVQQSSQGPFVYVLQEDGTVAIKKIKVGPTTGDRVVILDGVSVGDKVVLEGTDRLRAGGKVRVIDDAANGGGSAAGPDGVKTGGVGDRGAKRSWSGSSKENRTASQPGAPTTTTPAETK